MKTPTRRFAPLALAMSLAALSFPAWSATDRCALLKDAEVDEAIGPHERGTSDVTNLWGTNACRWVAKNAPSGAKAPEGWRDSLEVAVFEGNQLKWTQDQARNAPEEAPDAAKGARWNRSGGEVWFDCAGGRVCAVKLRTASSKQRKENAFRLAKLVESRVR